MTFAITADPVLTASDIQGLLGVASSQQAILLANSLSQKLLRFTNRCQINENQSANIVEKIRPYGGDKLYLHAPIWTGSGFTIEAAIYEGISLLDTYTYSGGDFGYQTNDYVSYLTLPGLNWPDQTLRGHVQVTYKGGWATVPADVVQGAIMQGRVDLKRMEGEVGVTSRGSQGESTAYDTAGIVKEVADLWRPYRIAI